MEASDGGVPPRVTNTTVRVTISTNHSRPEFAQREHEVALEETVAVGDVILTVTASYAVQPMTPVSDRLISSRDIHFLIFHFNSVYTMKSSIN